MDIQHERAYQKQAGVNQGCVYRFGFSSRDFDVGWERVFS